MKVPAYLTLKRELQRMVPVGGGLLCCGCKGHVCASLGM